MATDISYVKRNLFGISFLKDEFSKKRVYKLWEERFSPKNAFWLEASADDTVETTIDKCIQLIERQRITALSGKPCVLAFFVDCTEALSDSMLDILERLAAAMEGLLNCEIHAEIQFCYVGKLKLGPREAQRNSLRQAVANNSKKVAGTYHRLCLVATPPLGAMSSNEWKAAIVYLDMLRRCEPISNMIPTPGEGNQNENVGYLRYEEHDKLRHEKLVAQKEELERLLGQNGEQKLSEMVAEKRNEMKELVEERFAIVSGFQPQHMDMIVEDKFSVSPFGNQRKLAQRGNFPPYSRAAAATRSAIAETAERMSQEILEFYQETADQASALLDRMFEEAQIGIQSKRDRVQMCSCLKMSMGSGSSSGNLVLNYNPNGCLKEIQDYLQIARENAIAKGTELLSDALKKAFLAITDEQIDEQESILSEQLSDVKQELERIPDVNDMCKEISRPGGDPRECMFRVGVSLSVRSHKFFLCRTDEMERVVDHYAEGSDCGRYKIRHPNGGIAKPDSAPLKAMKIVYVDCNDEALKQLLREVIV